MHWYFLILSHSLILKPRLKNGGVLELSLGLSRQGTSLEIALNNFWFTHVRDDLLDSKKGQLVGWWVSWCRVFHIAESHTLWWSVCYLNSLVCHWPDFLSFMCFFLNYHSKCYLSLATTIMCHDCRILVMKNMNKSNLIS